MFWKKKKEQTIKLFSYIGACRREAARVNPPTDYLIMAFIGGQPADVLNISAGGMAIRCIGLKPGETLAIALELPNGEMVVKGTLEILKTDEENICHGRFLDLSEEMVEAIHKYALEAQKKNSREQKESEHEK